MPIPRNYDHNQEGGSPEDHTSPRAKHHAGKVEKHSQESGDTSTGETQHNSVLQHRSQSRQEIIARIKNDARPAWLRVDQHTQDVLGVPTQRSPAQEVPAGGLSGLGDNELSGQASGTGQNHRTLAAESSRHTQLARSAIERPKSALHKGDFRDPSLRANIDSNFSFPSSNDHYPQALSTSPPVQWNPLFADARAQPRSSVLHASHPSPGHVSNRDRAVSHSSLSSALLRLPPTSPLALQANANDSDDDRARSRSPSRSSRRRTFSPEALRGYRPSLASSKTVPPTVPSLRRGAALPRQAHQPSRSISSLHAFSIPQTPTLRSRRNSLFSEASPLQGTQMIGSYEESILRGRMSSIPSRPLDFLAQIGVLGKGDCKSSLKCPPHIAIPFPAVFYHYGANRNGLEAGPSPYVGMVDLENREKQPVKRKASTPHDANADVPMLSISDPPQSKGSNSHRRRGTDGARAHPTGGYRIPQQGQLQVIIKNPHKTAVKLFLIPYDLSDMRPGQKTFIRQRSYSAGPILDMPMDARKNLGTDRPEAAISNSEDPNDRPVLRYLVHLHICCPSRGRYYLYKSLRVVFANRVPDGKEKLRNEVQLPQPKYSTYKPETERASITQEGGRPRGFSLNSPSATAYPSYGEADYMGSHLRMPKPRYSFGNNSLADPIPEIFSDGPGGNSVPDMMQLSETPQDSAPLHSHTHHDSADLSSSHGRCETMSPA